MDIEEQLEFLLGSLPENGAVTFYKDGNKIILQVFEDSSKDHCKEYEYGFVGNAIEAAAIDREMRR